MVSHRGVDRHEDPGVQRRDEQPAADGSRAAAERLAATEKLEKVVIRFAGDSGDGMQLTGDRFTHEAAAFGNDLATQPNFPAEIRAPQGTLPGVSSFQIQIADYDILTAGDQPDVLVAMNPAALKANLGDLARGAILIVNTDEFTKRNLAKVGYAGDPLADDTLADFVVHRVPMTSLTLGATEPAGVGKKDGQRAKNMFALGLLSWMYGRPIGGTEQFMREKFAAKPDIAEANILAFRAGWNYGETTEAFATTYEVAPARLPAGTYRQITGNTALAYGLVTAGQLAGLQVFLGTYPITPASDILHELSKHKNFGVTTFQAEDEIAGIGAALGAALGGALGVTSTSGPGLALKSETIGLAVMTELPLVIVDVQRGGPSTGLPTKTEQADLLQALYGRNGESPVAVLAPRSPADCFAVAVEAARIALTYRTPVLLLSDGAIANGSEPWAVPSVAELAPIDPAFEREAAEGDGDEVFQPYARDPETLARPLAVPGTKGLAHRIGGLEKADGSGNISYDPANHELMVRLRQAKIDGIAVPDLEVDDPFENGDGSGAELLLIGWGSSYGPIGEAVRRARRRGVPVAQAHLRHMNPMPANTGEVLSRYRTVVCPEMNGGQLAMLLRARYLVDVRPWTKVAGTAFSAQELVGVIDAALDGSIAELEADKAFSARSRATYRTTQRPVHETGGNR
jgi:2-oxoglutarate ferredoxin oxidoreductase subunit alpha